MTGLETGCVIIVVIGLDTKMKIVYGWHRAENEESTDKSKWKKNEREIGELQARTPACRAITRIVRAHLCPLHHGGGVLAKSMTFTTIIDV